MRDNISDILAQLSRTLTDRCRRDPDFRRTVALVGQWLSAVTAADHDVPARFTPTSSAPALSAPLAPADSAPRFTRPAPVGLRTRTFSAPTAPSNGSSSFASTSPSTLPSSDSSTHTGPPDLYLVAKRSALKAESCRWAMERRRRIMDGAPRETDIAPRDHSMYESAKSMPLCYLWALDPRGPELPDDDTLDTLSACHANLADAARLVADVMEWHHDPEAEDSAGSDVASASSSGLAPVADAVRLYAAAQSALRVGLSEEVGLSRPDQDQFESFMWLRWFTSQYRVYVDRHMRLDDPADPYDCDDLHDALAELRQRVDAARGPSRRRHPLLAKARTLATAVAEGETSNWTPLLQTVADMVADGVSPTDLTFRELLAPIVDDLPEFGNGGPRIPPVAQPALDEVRAFLVHRDTGRHVADSAPASSEPTD